MKLLSSRPIFLFASYFSSPPPYLFFISHFTTSTTPLSSSYRRHEDESRTVKVSVWWDFENCNIPAGVNVFKIAHSITAAVRANGIKGPLQITAFGDVSQLARSNQEALSSTGINLAHIPNGSFCFSDVLNTIWEYIMGSVNGITNWVLFVFWENEGKKKENCVQLSSVRIIAYSLSCIYDVFDFVFRNMLKRREKERTVESWLTFCCFPYLHFHFPNSWKKFVLVFSLFLNAI